MDFHRIGSVVLHAGWSGDRARPPVVFANSLGSDARIWDGVAARLAERYAILRYDKRGHGLSDTSPGPYTIDDHVDDLLGLLDALGLDRVALVGLSLGGLIAQRAALVRPEAVAALVLCDTAARIGAPDIWNDRIATAERQGLEAMADGIIERWLSPRFRTTNAAAARGWRTMVARQPVAGYVASCATLRDTDLSAAVPAIRAPTLCLTGDQDPVTTPEAVRATAALIPGSRFEIVADAGHLPCIEHPDIVAALIATHLAGAGWR